MTPHVIHRNGTITIALSWEHRPVALTLKAQRAIVLLCDKHDVRSCRVSQAGFHIGTDAGRCSPLCERITEILSDQTSWRSIPRHPRFTRELMVVRGNCDEWDYSRLAQVEVEYEMGV
jgi:hypothetical protein